MILGAAISHAGRWSRRESGGTGWTRCCCRTATPSPRHRPPIRCWPPRRPGRRRGGGRAWLAMIEARRAVLQSRRCRAGDDDAVAATVRGYRPLPAGHPKLPGRGGGIRTYDLFVPKADQRCERLAGEAVLAGGTAGAVADGRRSSCLRDARGFCRGAPFLGHGAARQRWSDSVRPVVSRSLLRCSSLDRVTLVTVHKGKTGCFTRSGLFPVDWGRLSGWFCAGWAQCRVA